MPQRPYTLDYVAEIFTDFRNCTATAITPTTCPSSAAGALQRHRLHGDGPPEGRDTKESGLRNFGMSRPRATARRCA